MSGQRQAIRCVVYGKTGAKVFGISRDEMQRNDDAQLGALFRARVAETRKSLMYGQPVENQVQALGPLLGEDDV